MNDFNRVIDFQKPLGFLFQKGGNGGHGVGTLQGMPNCGDITMIAPEQHGIGSVQCRDNAGLVLGRQH